MNKDVLKIGVMADELLRKEGFETNQIVLILTREETAKILRVHPSTVSRYALTGDLKSFKLGSRRLFKYSDVLSFFENLVDLRCISEDMEV
jgi:excisionase family DNA binding protein